MTKLITNLANSQLFFFNLTRISIFIVMAWIGGLKVCQYEAEGIVPETADIILVNYGPEDIATLKLTQNP